MAVANQAASRVVLFATGAVLVVAFAIISSARTVDAIVIWRVGSPHLGDTPSRVVPRSLQHESMQRRFQLAVEAFPAKGFAARFLDATTRNTAPDYTGETAIGHMPILLGLRKPAAQWQLLVATRDPITTSRFVKAVPAIAARLATSQKAAALPAPATLLSPADGQMPRRATGQRFGSFTWRSRPSDDVVAEIAEFVYPGDARLFVTRPSRPGSATRLSEGVLWTTHSEWRWRVWSINRSGDVVLSEARRFVL